MKCTSQQARNQLGTPGGAKSFPRGAKMFWTMSNIFKLCPTDFPRWGEKKRIGSLKHLQKTGFSILLVFSTLFLCVFRVIFRWFRVLVYPSTSGFTIILHVFSECWLVDPVQWPEGPFYLSLPPLLKTLVTPLSTAAVCKIRNVKRRIFWHFYCPRRLFNFSCKKWTYTALQKEDVW